MRCPLLHELDESLGKFSFHDSALWGPCSVQRSNETSLLTLQSLCLEVPVRRGFSAESHLREVHARPGLQGKCAFLAFSAAGYPIWTFPKSPNSPN